MFNIYSVNYSFLGHEKAEDLFVLRKNTFKDRLQWAVTCSDGKEHDQFDNENTDYIFGAINDVILCGTRMIDMKHNNMLNHAFSSFFKNVSIPEGNYVESTRFFVDKERTHSHLGGKYPVTMVLFLSLINYARRHQYDGILAVASHSMMSIIRRSGWNVTVLDIGTSEKEEPVYLLLGHTDTQSLEKLKAKALKALSSQDETELGHWPLAFSHA